MPVSKLVIWSADRGEWVSRANDEIIWLDRTLLSTGRDRSLHRPPRCPALRYVHHRWELFSRDTSHPAYVAPFLPGDNPDYRAVAAAAQHVLPTVRPGLETLPVRLQAGAWAVGVGKWVVFTCIDVAPDGHSQTIPYDDLPDTCDLDGQGGPFGPDIVSASAAVGRVARYFQHNPMAQLTMAYYYQDFIRGELAPHAIPMLKVAVALDLTSEGAISEYKKELQRRIWNEQGHQRELGKFLLGNGLISQSDLTRALQVAAENQATGRTRIARERVRYKVR
jgi:hypothetical protein